MQDSVNVRVGDDAGGSRAMGEGAPEAEPRSESAAERSGFRATSTVFWIPGISHERGPARAGRPTVAEQLAVAVPAEGPLPASARGAGSGEGASTIVVTGAPAPVVPAPTNGPKAPRREPFRVGAYEVAARIAQGGMGSVYLCRRAGGLGFRRLYALKVIRQHASPAEATQAFQREAYLGAYLDHPSLQRVIEVGTYENQPFLILDYVEGASLEDLVREGPRPPVRAVVSILIDVLRGLHYAHTARDEQGAALGIVHGDLSPSNVLVGVDGCGRVTDFGCATLARERRDDAAGSAEQRARRPRFGGKPAYTAPEILCGEMSDARSDVFAAGVIMWQLLTGEKLFAADSSNQTVLNVLRKRVPPPSTFGAPACLDEICLRACVRAPEGRFASAGEMAQALLRVATEHDLLGGADEVGAWVRREWGERLEERRRWTQQAFAATPEPPGPRSMEREAGVSRPVVPAGQRLPAKTIQLAAVLSPGAAGSRDGLEEHLEDARWVDSRRPSRRTVSEVGAADAPEAADDADDIPADLFAWWRRPWVVIGFSALVAFGLTLGASKLLDRSSPAPEETHASNAELLAPR